MFYKKKEKRNKASSNQIYELTLGAYHYDTRRNIPCAFFIKHKTIKFDQVAKRPTKNVYKSADQTSKSGKIALPQITAPFF